MISLKDVTVSFVDGRGTFSAVDHLTFDFPDRGLVFVTGESGAGKSTLLSVIGGLLRPDSGSVDFGGATFSYVFQDEGFVFSLSLLDNLRLVEPDQTKIAEALSRVGLKNKMKEPISLLSKGERARLAVARALLSRPSAILLDEPTGNLDSRNAEIVYGLLESVSKEELIVVVSHDADAAARHGDIVLRMKDGKLERISRPRPLPGAGPVSPARRDRRIPWGIRWRYAAKNMFAARSKLVLSSLSLFLSGALLIMSLNFAFYDGAASAKKAAAASAPLFFSTSYDDAGVWETCSRPYAAHLASLGIDPTYQIVEYLIFLGHNNPGNARLFLTDSIRVGDVSYTPANGQAVVSDYLCRSLGATVGSDLGDYYSEFKGLGITVGQEAETGFESMRPRFPDTAAGDQSYSMLLTTTYLFIAVNADTYLRVLEREGMVMWNLALGEDSGRTTGCQLYTDALGNPTLLYGSYPSAKDEIMLGEGLAEDISLGDEAGAVGKELPVYPSTHDYYGMSAHFQSLKVCGVLAGSWNDGFYAASAFFEELKGEVKFESQDIVFGKDALLAYVEAGRPKDVSVMPAAVADPLKSADEITSAMATARDVLLTVGCLLGGLSLALLALYSLDAMRRGEKDIAILKSVGKGSPSIVSMFLLMDFLLVTGALALSLTAGFLLTFWASGIVRSAMFLSFDPIPNVLWSFLIVALAAYLFPLTASLLAGRAVYRTDVSEVFKRNLS